MMWRRVRIIGGNVVSIFNHWRTLGNRKRCDQGRSASSCGVFASLLTADRMIQRSRKSCRVWMMELDAHSLSKYCDVFVMVFDLRNLSSFEVLRD
jgi:hypothetical protein